MGTKSNQDKKYFKVIFLKIKINTKVHDEQNIKNLTKGRISYHTKAFLEPKAKRRTSSCDPEASTSLISSCRRVCGSLSGFLRVHDWHIYFHNILLAQASHRAGPGSRDWEANPTSPPGRSSKIIFHRV